MTIIASPISYLTGDSRYKKIAWLSKQVDDDPTLVGRLTILRSYTYPALHRSFIHRVLSFLSFMISSFITGLGVKNIDLVWGTSPPIFQGFTALLLARIKGCHLIFEVRDLWPAFAIAIGVLKNWALIHASEWLEKFLYAHADLVLINSPGFNAHVKQRGAKRIELIPNGADTDMFHQENDGAEFRRKHHLGGKFVALYAGAHGLSNDLGIVIEAAALLKDRQDIIFVLLGDGKDKPKLQAHASSLNLSNLIFLPPLPKLEIADALASANACIAILKPIEMYKTVYPNKVFDYMAAGRPVILAIDGVIREVIEQAEGGIPVSPGDPRAMANAIRNLADNPLTGKVMGSNARQYIERYFNRTVLADQLLCLFQSLLLD